MLNFHSLFVSNNFFSFINQLDLDDSTLSLIKECRQQVRDHLRHVLPITLKQETKIDFPTSPKFYTQGSYSYKTLNTPAHIPPQQADIDYGCYLPTEDWLDNYQMPRLACTDYFNAVEVALLDLCKRKGWLLKTNKATCIRLIINKNIHVDIPLYAIPQKEFERLMEARQLAMDQKLTNSQPLQWERLPTECVMLAHRERGWVKSDPRLVVDWFNHQVDIYSQQYRRVVRYLKAFRDFSWESGGPSSLLIMVLAASKFKYCADRDDLALFEVCKTIPDLLSTEIKNPTDSNEILTDRLDNVELTIQRFRDLKFALEEAIMHSSNSNEANDIVRQQFGDRFPFKPEWIRTVNPEAAIAPLTFNLQNNELIGRTRAG